MAARKGLESDYFRNLTLRDIYGNFPDVIDGAYVVAPSEELTWWAPHNTERALLYRLINAVSTDGFSPFVVDAACGTGFLGKLLAVENSFRVLGVDIDQATLDRLPITGGDYRLERKNVWNLVDQLGPSYPDYLKEERRRLLDFIYQDTADMHPYFCYHGTNAGVDDAYKNEIVRLQQIAPQGDKPTLVDLAICSHMERNIDLTIPLRDGVFPRSLVYVRQVEGCTGAGDFYLEKNPKPTYSPISFNPGENYQTVARWLTVGRNDWDRYNHGHGIEFWAEVIVQLRKDAALKTTGKVNVTNYPWDHEILKLLAESSKKDEFLAGVNLAANDLFGS